MVTNNNLDNLSNLFIHNYTLLCQIKVKVKKMLLSIQALSIDFYRGQYLFALKKSWPAITGGP